MEILKVYWRWMTSTVSYKLLCCSLDWLKWHICVSDCHHAMSCWCVMHCHVAVSWNVMLLCHPMSCPCVCDQIVTMQSERVIKSRSWLTACRRHLVHRATVSVHCRCTWLNRWCQQLQVWHETDSVLLLFICRACCRSQFCKIAMVLVHSFPIDSRFRPGFSKP